jgi:hypothetical protein
VVAKDGQTYLRRVSMNLPEAQLIDLQELALKMRRNGTQVSLSALVEVAIKELVTRENVISMIRKLGAGARRSNGKPAAKARRVGSEK